MKRTKSHKNNNNNNNKDKQNLVVDSVHAVVVVID